MIGEIFETAKAASEAWNRRAPEPSAKPSEGTLTFSAEEYSAINAGMVALTNEAKRLPDDGPASARNFLLTMRNRLSTLRPIAINTAPSESAEVKALVEAYKEMADLLRQTKGAHGQLLYDVGVADSILTSYNAAKEGK